MKIKKNRPNKDEEILKEIEAIFKRTIKNMEAQELPSLYKVKE